MDSVEAPQANGLKTMVDTIVSPNDAFASIRSVPTWGWAFLVTLVLGVVGSILITPATTHALAAGWPTLVAQNPQLQQLTPAQQQTQLNFVLKFAQFAWIGIIFFTPFVLLLQTLLLAVFNALGHGEGKFKHYWAASANIAVPSFALYSIVAAVIAMARGADSFNSLRSMQTSLPSLAMLAPDASIKLTAALATINPFSIWGAVLATIALLTIGRVSRVQAWLAGVLWIALPALFTFATAR